MNIPVFTPNELENYAAILTWALLRIRKKPFRKNEYVQIRFDADALLLAEETAAHLLEKNLEPVLRLMPTPRIERDYYLMTDVRRLGRVIPGEEELARNIGGTISLFAPASLNHMSSVSAERLNIARRNRAALSKITRERENQGLYTWTLCMYPTQALADAAGMSITEYATQIRKACFLDQPDPVDRWTRTMKEARRIAARLTALGNCALHVESENTDLRFNCLLYTSCRTLSAAGATTSRRESVSKSRILSSVGMDVAVWVIRKLSVESGFPFLSVIRSVIAIFTA